MDEIWERAVEAALDGQTDVASVRSLTLDGAVKCLHGRLPQPSLFEKFHSLQHFSIANIGVSSLEQFPHLRNLQRLILSDNRIAGGLEFLVEAGLGSLRDLDLSNNRISDINDLRPLAELRLVSLDLYECPVTRVKDYRAQVFGLIRSLKYLDKMDVDENERPESEDEEEDEEEEEEDPGSGEVDGEDHPFRLNNGIEGVVDVEEDEESDADEEETETPRVVDELSRGGRDSHPHSNGFGVFAVNGDDDDDDDDDEDDDDEDDDDDDDDEGEDGDDLVEVHEDDEGEDEDVVEVHEIDVSEDEDGVEYDEEEDEDEEEEVNNDERDFGEAGGTGKLTSTEGEIDGHEQGEDDADEDDNGETGEEEQAVKEDGDFDDEDEEEDYGNGYLVQPVGRAEPQTGGSDMDPGDEYEDPKTEEDLEEDDDEEDLDGEIQELPSSSSHKRKRNEDSHDDDCEDGDGDGDGDVLPYSKSSKHH